MGKKESIESSLLAHERALIRRGKLQIQEPDQDGNDDDAFIWLYAIDDDDEDDIAENEEEYEDNDEYDDPQNENPLARTQCYRTMADDELLHLVQHNELPSTLPFQTLFHGRPGLDYCASRLMLENNNNNNNNNSKAAAACNYSNTAATTVVEFDCDENFVERLFSIQCKVLENKEYYANNKKQQEHEHAAILTHSMGFRASRTLALLNEALQRGDVTFRILLVKRKRRARRRRHQRRHENDA